MSMTTTTTTMSPGPPAAPAGAWARPIHDDHTRIIQMDEACRAAVSRPVQRMESEPLRRRWRPRTAFLLSLFPGLGHLYRGSARGGLVWIVITALAYIAWPPLGTACHVLCALHATAADPWGL